MKKFSKRLLSALMVLMIVISAFPLTSYAKYITNMNSDAVFGVISGSYADYGHELHYAKYDGSTYITFCCEYGVESPTGTTYKYGSDFKAYLNRNDGKYETIADYIAFGYTLVYGDGLPNTKAEKIAACCTQQYVWEKLGVNPTRSSWVSTYMSDDLYKDWKKDTEDRMNEYYKTHPSFDGTTKTMNLGASTTLTDSNGVFKYYPTFSKTINKVTFSHTKGENKLTISVADNCSTHSVTFKSASYDIFRGLPDGTPYDADAMNYVYFDFDKGTIQDLMFSNYVDPETFGISVNIEFGSLKLVKTSEDGIVDGITFNVSGNGINKNVVTKNGGEFQIDGLVPGTYTVTEVADTRYVQPKSQTVKVENGKTASVSFTNTLKKGKLKVQKDSDDHIVKDFTFIVSSSTGKTYPITSDSSGVATLTDLPVYDSNNKKISYTVKETSVPIRYVTPDKQTVILEPDKISSVTVDNILKKFRVKVIKEDIEKGKAQGDASLAGAVYGLYKGDELIAEYTTDENASFITDYYVCDTDWTLKEISSSEGYLVNGTIYKVGADPREYKVEFNTTENKVQEQVVKGKISIIKHTDDGSTQIETPEKNAEFQIYLKSSGSYAKADKDERDTLVCDEDGFASSKELPYGTYTVHQTKGWDGREKIKDFDVYINQDGKTYRFLINNSEFCSYLKVVKFDKETNKPIEEQGYEVVVLDLINMEKSHCYNPFVYLQDDNDVQRLVTNLFKSTTPKGAQSNDPFWDTAAQMLLLALIFYLFYEAPPEEQNFAMVMELLREGDVPDDDTYYESPLDILFKELEDTNPFHIAVKYFRAYHSGSAKTLKSIQITLASRLEKFNLEGLAKLTSCDELDLSSMGERKVALFAVIPDNDTSFNFLVFILYTQLFQQLFYSADQVHGGSLPIPVHFLMDEFANVSLPEDFDKILSVMRSRNVFVSIILQNLAQLKALFEKQWESIVGNCDQFLYLGGNEQSTHKYVSELLGKETIDTNTFGRSFGRNGNYSTNYQITGRELMTPDEVRMLDNQYCILFIRGERPVIDLKYDILKHPNVEHTADGSKKIIYEHGQEAEAKAQIEFFNASDNFDYMDITVETDYELVTPEMLEEEFRENDKNNN